MILKSRFKNKVLAREYLYMLACILISSLTALIFVLITHTNTYRSQTLYDKQSALKSQVIEFKGLYYGMRNCLQQKADTMQFATNLLDIHYCESLLSQVRSVPTEYPCEAYSKSKFLKFQNGTELKAAFTFENLPVFKVYTENEEKIAKLSRWIFAWDDADYFQNSPFQYFRIDTSELTSKRSKKQSVAELLEEGIVYGYWSRIDFNTIKVPNEYITKFLEEIPIEEKITSFWNIPTIKKIWIYTFLLLIGLLFLLRYFVYSISWSIVEIRKK